MAHDFLWRVHPHAPGRGEVAIFNRSHYEDVLVTRVHKLIDKPTWTARYERAQVASQVVMGDRSASCFTFAYPATRKSANRIDIKITITPVAKANRSANKRRIGSP
jgi:hypothetical protein